MKKTEQNPVNEMEQLAASIQEGTKNTLRDILSEAVGKFIKEEIINEDDDEEAEDVEETPDTETSDVEEFDETSDDSETEEEDPEEAAETENADGDEWADFDDFKITDDEGSEEYDFTNETNPETLIKVFKLMKNDDQVSVVKDGDKVSVKDNEAGTEYVIELNCDDSSDNNEEFNSEMTMAESLGYTDNYQDKDPIEGLSMDGSTPKNTKDWHKGVPTGTQKPWAGNGKSEPFGKKTEKVFEITLTDDVEMEEEPIEENHTRGGVTDRSTTISNARKGQPARNKRVAGQQVNGTADNPSLHQESLQKKIDAALLENKQLKETVAKVSKIMKEAVQVNVNLGHIVKLMVENSTTKAEKEDIVKRYSNVKSNEDAKALYESISSELKKAHSTVFAEQTQKTTVEGSKQINESKIYDEPNSVRDMMKRMGML